MNKIRIILESATLTKTFATKFPKNQSFLTAVKPFENPSDYRRLQTPLPQSLGDCTNVEVPQHLEPPIPERTLEHLPDSSQTAIHEFERTEMVQGRFLVDQNYAAWNAASEDYSSHPCGNFVWVQNCGIVGFVVEEEQD